MIIGGHGVRLWHLGIRGRARDIVGRPNTPKWPVNDDFDATTWFVFLAAPRERGLLPDPVRIGLARNCPKALAKMQHHGRPVLAMVARFPASSRRHAEALREAFGAEARAHALGGDWFDLDISRAVDLLRDVARRFLHARWPDLTEALHRRMLAYYWLEDLAPASEPKPAGAGKSAVPRRRPRTAKPKTSTSSHPQRARR